MTSQACDAEGELMRLVAGGRISIDALQAMTGISVGKLQAVVDRAIGARTAQPSRDGELSPSESARLSLLVVELTEGLRFGADERLVRMLESLTGECHLTLKQIALLTDIDVDLVETALRNPRGVSVESRYELAVRCSYLINAINRARAA